MKRLALFLWILLMPASVTVSHALSATTPDNPAYEIRPSHWNSGHDVTVSLNISATEISGLFSNANGISFGLSDSSITASHNALTTAALSNHSHGASAANGSFAFQTLSFSNANAFSFGTSAGSAITGSYTVPTVTNSSWTVSDAATSGTVGRLAFTNLNGVTLSLSSGTGGLHTIVGSHNALTSQSNQAVSNSAGSFTFQTLNFSNANNVTWGTSAGGIVTASVAAPGGGAVVSNAIQQVSSATGSGTNTSRFAADDHVHAGVYHMGVSNDAGNTSGNTKVSFGRFVLRGGDNITLSQITAANELNTVVISAAAGGAGVIATQVYDVATAGSTGTVTRYAPEDHRHAGVPVAGISGGNTSGETGTRVGSVMFAGGANITVSGATAAGGQTITISAAAPGGAATYSNFFEPFFYHEATNTTSGSLSQLHLQAFSLPVNLSFGQINMLGSVSFQTSVANTATFRLTPNTNMQWIASYSISNSGFVDLFLFSRGTGSYSTALYTQASTRNSLITNFFHTHHMSVNHTAGSTGSWTLRRTMSVSLSYPMLTSGTTSPGAGTTHTTWGTGYTTWQSTASNSGTNTYNTTNTASASIASTFPAHTEWSSIKMWPLHFGTSLTPGQWYIGMVGRSSTSSSSSSTHTNATATGNSFTVNYNVSANTMTGSRSWLGDTMSIASSLGWPGQNTANSMAPSPGQGSFSGTWHEATTYLNNAATSGGAVAFSQLRTQISFFRTWMQFASQRI